MLVELLKKWDREKQRLLFVGDLADRGPDSKSSMELVQQLVSTGEAICLTGNHEQIFLNFLSQPDEVYGNYMINGGAKTIASLLPHVKQNHSNSTEIADQLRIQYPDLIAFISSLPLYYEWHGYLFVHAGVDLSLQDWAETKTKDFYWIREPFHQGINNTGKVPKYMSADTIYLNQISLSYFIDNGIDINLFKIYLFIQKSV